MINHYVYKIENVETSEYYIGVRSCQCEIEEDSYMGSSTVWNREYLYTNKTVLIKHILDVLDNRPLANIVEAETLAQCYGDKLCINVDFSAKGSPLGRKLSQETRDKQGRWQKGVAKSDQVRAKLSEAHKKKYQEGYRQPTSKPVIVEDILEGTIIEYPSNTDFCITQGFDKQSVGVFIRKGLVYKKRWKVRYKELTEQSL